MSWRRVAKSAQAFIAHGLLFCFTLLVLLKLNHVVTYSWCSCKVTVPKHVFLCLIGEELKALDIYCLICRHFEFICLTLQDNFFPTLVVSHNCRTRQVLLASSISTTWSPCMWAPCHAVVATPLLVAFEILLCVYLEGIYAVNLKIVFVPLLAFELIILIDNFRMCRALMPGDEESMSDEAIWETLPHFWVAISMVFFVAATMFTLLKLSGDVGALGWWDLFINFCIAECFAFLVCTKWSNPVIHAQSRNREPRSSSTAVRFDRNSGLLVTFEDDQYQDRMCGLQDIGGHIMKVPLVGFQILLCMRLEGTPPSARHIPLSVLFGPLLLLQGLAVFFALLQSVERIYLLLNSEDVQGRYFSISSTARDFFGFLHRGSRLLGWWSIDEGSREEQARLYHSETAGYNTFSRCPPEAVKKMPRKDLAEEVWRLQASLGEQTQITKYSQEEFERLQNEKVLCRICFEGDINIILLPCKHRILCRYPIISIIFVTCSEKCKRCPVCRVPIEEGLLVYDDV
ncbi:hypothetical protein C5167_050277 [Papaver somniferum]|uniref:RING-type domain-containing protein n=1 Tax=Papaver somniferum TaxID=3469 RepID=A0A4Y7KN78_PAPSO|nr:hypothetical protein C5167_050277 [Papaver somniferum]